jgi:hypothetical protein
MVEVNELRIGNWLDGINGRFQVLTIYPYKIAYKIANALGEFSYYLKEDCEPILITKDIIELCGFNQTKWEDDVYENETGDSIEFIKATEDKPAYINFFTAQNYDHSVKVYSVHQLQNIFFAINNKELEVAFG